MEDRYVAVDDLWVAVLLLREEDSYVVLGLRGVVVGDCGDKVAVPLRCLAAVARGAQVDLQKYL